MRHLVLSQCTRVTDRQTEEQTDGQNYDSQDRLRICSRGNKAAQLLALTLEPRLTVMILQLYYYTLHCVIDLFRCTEAP